MKRFAALFTTLDQTTSTNAKTAALQAYFEEAPDPDKLWTIAILSGRRPKRSVTTTLLRQWAAEQAGIDAWLFDECYRVVGDLAETIALVLPPARQTSDRSLTEWIEILRHAGTLDEAGKRQAILNAWSQLETIERFLFNKLLTGGFRVGVSQKLMTRALAGATNQEEAALAHRLMGDWTSDTTTFHDLVLADDPAADLSKPYPFYLAHQLDVEPDTLGPPGDWLIERKWDGIRGQVILRAGVHFTWSRGEELMTQRFPELARLEDFLPSGTVLDGEILAWSNAKPLPFAKLQKRIGRKTVPKKLLQEAPVILMAYDLLEWRGEDIRMKPMIERRALLESALRDLPGTAPIQISQRLQGAWDQIATERDRSRDLGAEGLMLKRLSGPYQVGRKKGDWWKWKVDPLSIDAVMIYAQAGHGRRATLFTDYTFAVWDGDALVPFTKAYSGLTDAEFREITAWVRKNTRERFGPVRSVPAELVFEIHFEGIQPSSRHKSGVALRFPRMARWRRDKPVAEANTLDDLRGMLEAYG